MAIIRGLEKRKGLTSQLGRKTRFCSVLMLLMQSSLILFHHTRLTLKNKGRAKVITDEHQRYVL